MLLDWTKVDVDRDTVLRRMEAAIADGPSGPSAKVIADIYRQFADKFSVIGILRGPQGLVLSGIAVGAFLVEQAFAKQAEREGLYEPKEAA